MQKHTPLGLCFFVSGNGLCHGMTRFEVFMTGEDNLCHERPSNPGFMA